MKIFSGRSVRESRKKASCTRSIPERGNLDELAYEAAKESMLGSGIGVTGQRAAMQMARLPMGKNVFELNAPRFWQCRNLGSNSARAVKKMPFKPVYGQEETR